MRTDAPIGWRKELPTRGAFPQTWEDTAAVEKSKMRDSETLDAPAANPSFFKAGEHAGAYHSLDESKRELGPVVVINKLGCALKTNVYSEVKAYV